MYDIDANQTQLGSGGEGKLDRDGMVGRVHIPAVEGGLVTENNGRGGAVEISEPGGMHGNGVNDEFAQQEGAFPHIHRVSTTSSVGFVVDFECAVYEDVDVERAVSNGLVTGSHEVVLNVVNKIPVADVIVADVQDDVDVERADTNVRVAGSHDVGAVEHANLYIVHMIPVTDNVVAGSQDKVDGGRAELTVVDMSPAAAASLNLQIPGADVVDAGFHDDGDVDSKGAVAGSQVDVDGEQADLNVVDTSPAAAASLNFSDMETGLEGDVAARRVDCSCVDGHSGFVVTVAGGREAGLSDDNVVHNISVTHSNVVVSTLFSAGVEENQHIGDADDCDDTVILMSVSGSEEEQHVSDAEDEDTDILDSAAEVMDDGAAKLEGVPLGSCQRVGISKKDDGSGYTLTEMSGSKAKTSVTVSKANTAVKGLDPGDPERSRESTVGMTEYRCPLEGSPESNGGYKFDQSGNSVEEAGPALHSDSMEELTGQFESVKIEEEDVEEATVRQARVNRAKAMTMLVPITVARRRVAAVVDSGAQVTLMSRRLGDQLELKRGKTIQLKNAQVGSTMEGVVIDHFGFQLGGRKYFTSIVVADIEDDFILGMDFMKHEECRINLAVDCLEMGNGDFIHAMMKVADDGQRYHVSRVMVEKRTKVAPGTVRFVKAKLEHAADVKFALEPRQAGSLMIIPSLFEGDSPVIKVAVVNLGEKSASLPRNFHVAQAVEADETLDVGGEDIGQYVNTGEYREEGESGEGEPGSTLLPEDTSAEAEEPQGVKEAGSSPLKESYEIERTVEERQSSEKLGPPSLWEELRCAVGDSEPTTILGPSATVRSSKLGDDRGSEVFASSEAADNSEDDKSGARGCQGRPQATEMEYSEEELPKIDTLPAHLHQLYSEALPRLDHQEVWKLYWVLMEYADVFAKDDLDIGTFQGLEHWIRTGTGRPRRQSMHRTPLGFEQEEKKVLNSMKEAGVIEPSQSEWASPPVLVRKKDQSWRYCIDFRYLNSVSIKDAYPLPLIEECIDALTGVEWFCALDMNSGYWQIPIAEEDRPKTAFITKYGLFQFLRMPFGLVNAPASFQRAMHVVLAGLIWEAVIVYLDDINVLGRTFEETLGNLKQVLERFRVYGLKLKPRKCALFRREVVFLGRLVNKNGVRMTDEHVKALQEWPVPKSRKDVEKFLGFINYHRRFLMGLAGKTQVLYGLTGPRAKWHWTNDHEVAFDTLKRAMVEAPVLALPNATDAYILDADASDVAVGAELSQVQDGVERPVAYSSKVLSAEQRRYCTTRKELLAVVVFTRQFRHYLLGRAFVVRTDHASLVWLLNFKNAGGQLARWMAELGQYDFTIEHRKGEKHSNADGLSRIPQKMECDCYVAGLVLDTLPCGGCSYCQRVRKQWEVFEEEVDDVVPIAFHHRRQATVGMVGLADRSLSVTPVIITDEVLEAGGDGFVRQDVATASVLESVSSSATSVFDPDIQSTQVEGSALKGVEGAVHRSLSVAPVIITDEVLEAEGDGVGRRDGATVNTAEPASSSSSEVGDPELKSTQANGAEHDRTGGVAPLEKSTRDSNFLQQVEPAEVRKQQSKDPELRPVILWLEDEAVPTQAQLQACSPNTRHLWLCRTQLELDKGVLYYKWETGNRVERLLVVPGEMKREVLEYYHDALTGGHHGRDKTYAKVRERFYWYGMSRDVGLHVGTCAVCSRNKRTHRHPRAPLEHYQAGCPGDRVHLDILGPFKESEQGKKYVLMIIDQFSRWLEMVPLPNQEAETIARAFFESYVVRFGVPFMVHTDQGRNFESHMFKAFCSLMEITKTRTTPYRPSSNGQVERYNTLVLNFLRCYLAGKQRTWDQYLPVLGMAVRATVNRNTGYTPNMLMLGHEVTMPTDVVFGQLREKPSFNTPSLYLKFLVGVLEKVHTEVRDNIKGAQIRQKRYYDVKSYMRRLEVGDLVYKRNASFRPGESRKLNPLYAGPYVVVEVVTSALFRVVDKKGTYLMHHDRLKLCEDRDVPLWAKRKRHDILRASGTNDADVEPRNQQAGAAAIVVGEAPELNLPAVDQVAQADVSTGDSITVEWGDNGEAVDDASVGLEEGGRIVMPNSDLDLTVGYDLEEDDGVEALQGLFDRNSVAVQTNEQVLAQIKEPHGDGEDGRVKEPVGQSTADHVEVLEMVQPKIEPAGGRRTRVGRPVRPPKRLGDYVTY